MKANRSRDTGPEMALRRALHGLGLRYRIGLRIRLGAGSTRPDIVFTRAKLAVFVDGCFWHRCPEHATNARSNVDFWREKLERNVQRDRATDAALSAAGWTVVRIWEHEDPAVAAGHVWAELEASAAGPSS
jgi:DNA mismatch endonuclease, patch repair protein